MLEVYFDKYAKDDGMNPNERGSLRANARLAYENTVSRASDPEGWSNEWTIVRASDIRGYDTTYRELERRFRGWGNCIRRRSRLDSANRGLVRNLLSFPLNAQASSLGVVMPLK